MFKIFLAGATGHMGREVILAAKRSKAFEIVAGFGIKTDEQETQDFPLYRTADEVTEDFDVLIDFSNPALLNEIIKLCKARSKPMVLATTGFNEAQEDLIVDCAKEIAVFRSANMSLGVNLLAHLAQIAADVLYPDFDIEIVEAHHRRKKDAPSGTALLLADAIREKLLSKDNLDYVYDRSKRDTARPQAEIGLSAIRGGNIVGEHDIYFAGNGEVITLKHSALSREVFADGAIHAASFIIKQDKGLYSMKDLF